MMSRSKAGSSVTCAVSRNQKTAAAAAAVQTLKKRTLERYSPAFALFPSFFLDHRVQPLDQSIWVFKLEIKKDRPSCIKTESSFTPCLKFQRQTRPNPLCHCACPFSRCKAAVQLQTGEKHQQRPSHTAKLKFATATAADIAGIKVCLMLWWHCSSANANTPVGKRTGDARFVHTYHHAFSHKIKAHCNSRRRNCLLTTHSMLEQKSIALSLSLVRVSMTGKPIVL